VVVLHLLVLDGGHMLLLVGRGLHMLLLMLMLVSGTLHLLVLSLVGRLPLLVMLGSMWLVYHLCVVVAVVCMKGVRLPMVTMCMLVPVARELAKSSSHNPMPHHHNHHYSLKKT
jgi:hypothetical protein